MSRRGREARGGRRARGFTLIEVLVSLAIFALAAVVLGAAYVNVLTSYSGVSRREAHERELQLVRVAVLVEPDRRAAERGGTVVLPDGRPAQWSATIEEAPVADLFRVAWHCEIGQTGQGATAVRDEEFFLLRPTWSDPVVRDRLRQETQRRLAKKEAP